jgi:hypothetical protein
MSNEPPNSDTSIRVLSGPDGALLWEMPSSPSEPTRVPLVIDGDQWRGYVFLLSYVGAELTGLEIKRDTAAEPLGRVALQQVPLGSLDRAARQCVGRFLEEWDRVTGDTTAQMAYLRVAYPDTTDWLDAVADPNTAREDDALLARLCKRYLQLGGESGWRMTLADEFNYAESSIQTIIGRARRRRFLTPVARGQFGGQLTPKALRLLAPTKQQSAWDRATAEQREAAIERDRREAELYEQFAAGTIGADAYEAAVARL